MGNEKLNPNDTAINDGLAGADNSELPNATEKLNPAKDERTLDVGESGQFAPGGYYNQHGVNEAERLDLDEYTATRTDDKSKAQGS
jgi:hypothetical protein